MHYTRHVGRPPITGPPLTGIGANSITLGSGEGYVVTWVIRDKKYYRGMVDANILKN